MTFAVLLGVIAMLIPLFSDQSANIVRALGNYYYQLRTTLTHSPSLLVSRLANFIPPRPKFLTSDINAAPPDVKAQLDMLIKFLGGTVRTAFVFISSLLLTFYLTIDRDRILFSVMLLVSTDKRQEAKDFYGSVDGKIAAYLRGLGIMCLSIGVLSLIAYLIIGLPYAVLLAVLGIIIILRFPEVMVMGLISLAIAAATGPWWTLSRARG